LANGDVNARKAERVVWDVIVVGTGMVVTFLNRSGVFVTSA
jgi:hypothetical protein